MEPRYVNDQKGMTIARCHGNKTELKPAAHVRSISIRRGYSANAYTRSRAQPLSLLPWAPIIIFIRYFFPIRRVIRMFTSTVHHLLG